jgi:beta-glucosidase/6-phospho-beta-glucosidase/beta-galactosidase
MFASFIQAGFECSSHRRSDGRRLDLLASTRHDQFVRQDYERLKTFGIRTVREGLRWHLIELTAGNYDFSSLLPLIAASQEEGIQVIWDLFHFGWPDHLDIFDPSWTDSLAELAFRFASLWHTETGARAFVAPLNEISFFAWAAGDQGFLNPFARNRAHELKSQLVVAGIKSISAIRSVLRDAVVVSPDPVIHIVGDPSNPDDIKHAEEYRLAMFESWDMLRGDARPELGGHAKTIDVLGINFYGNNQRWNFGTTIYRGDPAYRPFHLILKEVYDRYRLPLLISETGAEDEARADWFAYIAAEVHSALQMGVPVHGICIYPILNHPGWDDDRHCHNGLWDYADPDGFRALYEPLALEIQMQSAQHALTTGITNK